MMIGGIPNAKLPVSMEQLGNTNYDPGNNDQLPPFHEIKELVSLADALLPLGSQDYFSESVRRYHLGGLAFKSGIRDAEGEDFATTSIVVVGPSYLDDPDDELVELEFTKIHDAPILQSEDDNSLELARDISIGLIEQGQLSPLETELAYYTVSFLAGFIDDYYRPIQPITDADGSELTYFEAIGRAVTQRNADFMVAHIFDWEDPGRTTGLSVVKYESTNVHRYDYVPVIEISTYSEAEERNIVFRLFGDGSTKAIDSEALNNETEELPKSFHLKALKESVIRALREAGMGLGPPHYDKQFILDSVIVEPGKQTAHQVLAGQALAAYELFRDAPDDSHEKITAMDNYNEIMRTLRQYIESKYHLLDYAREITERPINLSHLDIEQPINHHGQFNKLIVNAPRSFLLNGSEPQEQCLAEDEYYVIEYKDLCVGVFTLDESDADEPPQPTTYICIQGIVDDGKVQAMIYIPLHEMRVFGYAPVRN